MSNKELKNPGLAAVLSTIMSGLGQIYNGDIGTGIFIMVLQTINLFLMMILIGCITYPLVWIWSIYDAYNKAKKMNEKIEKEL